MELVCASGQLDQSAQARLARPGAGAWADLIDGVAGARVLIIDESPGIAAKMFAGTADVVGFVDLQAARGAFRLQLLVDEGAEVTVGAEDVQRDRPGGWDLIVLDGTALLGSVQPRAAASRLASLGGTLREGGRIVAVGDNRLSPLRAFDRLRRRPVGQATSLRSVEGALRQAGCAVRQRFALLPSSVSPVIAFDLRSPSASSAVLSAASVRSSPWRALALRGLRGLAARGRTGRLVPAWLVVASVADEPWAPAADLPTGRIGYGDSEEAQVLRGDPPFQLEKRYLRGEAREREVRALQVLESVDFGLAPRLTGPIAPNRARQTWLPGTPLVPGGLRDLDVERWVAEAARVLGSVHRKTERDDGTVLVHGDFWLGNLLVQGRSVCGIVDWTDAHWGNAGEDLDHLVITLAQSRVVAQASVAGLMEVARRAHASTFLGEVRRGTIAAGDHQEWP